MLPAAVKTLWFVEQTADVETGEVMIFLASSFALTVRHGANDPTVEFRDAIQPLVPVMQPFTTARDGWPRQVVPYFRDVADHLTRTDTEVRALDDLFVSILDAHLAKVGTWQNDVMRRISAWAAIVAIPTMVAGIYGMNFDHMPELDWRYGYPCALAVMALGAGLLYRAFRRNGWL
ncbi:CorA family divalent cation transporter [Streptomyces nigrescens]|uniref:CorA family divalent cation transporter n=1 Tax=Streptomyces nigrescens TaxID=1920 RepID=UPI0034991602